MYCALATCEIPHRLNTSSWGTHLVQYTCTHYLGREGCTMGSHFPHNHCRIQGEVLHLHGEYSQLCKGMVQNRKQCKHHVHVCLNSVTNSGQGTAMKQHLHRMSLYAQQPYISFAWKPSLLWFQHLYWEEQTPQTVHNTNTSQNGKSIQLSTSLIRHERALSFIT